MDLRITFKHSPIVGQVRVSRVIKVARVIKKNETLDYTIRIGSTPTFLYFDLYLYSMPTQHTTFIKKRLQRIGSVEIII